MGHIAQVPTQVETYLQLARRPEVRIICEIGFNAGHSAAVFLSAKPDNVLVEFDVQTLPYSRPMEDWFKRNYGQRFHMVSASSIDSLPAFGAAGGRSVHLQQG